MPKKPTFKTIVSDKKIVFELSLEYLRAEVAHYNWRTIQLNREDPREKWTCFRITDGKLFMNYILWFLTKNGRISGNSLQDLVTYTIAEALEMPTRKNTGFVELPFGSKDAEAFKPAQRRPAPTGRTRGATPLRS